MKTILQGRRFNLVLEGSVQSCEVERGGEYCTYSTKEFWYEGATRIVEKETGQISSFLFKTWAAEVSNFSTPLEDHILISNRARFGYDSKRNPEDKLPLLENRRAELIDVVSQKALEEITADTESVIPRHFFGQLSYEWLVDQGYIPDSLGQISLQGMTSLSNV